MEINTTQQTRELKERSARLTQLANTEAQAGLVKWQIESENELQEMERFLLGYIWAVREGKYVLISSGRRWCNEAGATGIVSIVRQYLAKYFILTNLDEERVKSIMKDLSISLVQYLGYWYMDFEINEGDLPIIVKMLQHTIEANLRRSIGMKTFDGFTTTYQTKEEFDKKESPKRNFFSRFSSAFKLTK